MPNNLAITLQEVADRVLSKNKYPESLFEEDVKNVLLVVFSMNEEQVEYTYKFAFREGQSYGLLGVLESAENLAKYAQYIVNTQSN